MHLSSPALQRAWEEFQERRDSRRVMQVFGMPGPGVTHHTALKLAYVKIQVGQYMTVRYCGNCLRGYAVDLEHGSPDELPTVREVGAKMVRPWGLMCSEAKS